MDADTRHQLKQNELAAALVRLRDWSDKRLTYVLIVLAILLVFVAGWRWWRHAEDAAVGRGWQQLGELDGRIESREDLPGAIADLRKLADEADHPTLAAYARLTLAKALNEQALQDVAQRDANLREAAQVLERVRNDTSAPETVRAAALFALGSVQESQRNFDGARASYQALTTDAAFAGSPYRDIAQQRLADIDQLTAPVAFAPGNPPTATQPSDDIDVQALIQQIQQQMPPDAAGQPGPAPTSPPGPAAPRDAAPQPGAQPPATPQNPPPPTAPPAPEPPQP